MGVISVVLDESMRVSRILAARLKLTTNTKSLLFEMLIINNSSESRIIYGLLGIDGQLYRLDEHYGNEKYKFKVAKPYNVEVETLGWPSCRDVCWFACEVGCHIGVEALCHLAGCVHPLCILLCFGIALAVCHFILEEGFHVCSNGCDWICSQLGL